MVVHATLKFAVCSKINARALTETADLPPSQSKCEFWDEEQKECPLLGGLHWLACLWDILLVGRSLNQRQTQSLAVQDVSESRWRP